MRIQESGEMYLETILILGIKRNLVRAVDVAEAMHISKASVSRALGRLREEKCIIVDGNGHIAFTEKGRKIAEKIPSMDPETAYMVGLLHDIGRRVGIVDIPTHVYEGYRYCMEKGWDEVSNLQAGQARSGKKNGEPKLPAKSHASNA